MKSYSMLLTLPVLILSAGCLEPVAQGPKVATATPAAAPAGRGEPKVKCEMVRPTGSMIAEKQCRTIYQSEADRRAAQDFFQRPVNAAPPPPGSGR